MKVWFKELDQHHPDRSLPPSARHFVEHVAIVLFKTADEELIQLTSSR